MNKLYNTKIGGVITLLVFSFAFLGFVVKPSPKVKNSSSLITSFNPFGPAQGFGAFAFGDVDLIGTESEGPIAIGGDLIGFNNGYTVGPPVSPNPFPGSGTPIALLIDGSVNWSGGAGELRITAEGHLKIGDCSGTNVTQSGNITTASGGGGSSIKVQGPVPQDPNTVCESNLLDFDAAYSQMNGYSNDMSSCPATASLPNVNLGAGQNVINTTLSQISGINSVNMNGTIDQNNPLIINIDGQGAASGSWTVWNSTPQSSAIQYVIYHFYNIDNLTITANNGLWGSVFAPNTNLTISGNNNIEGQIVSQDLVDQGGEIHGHNNFASTIDGCGSGCTDPTVPTLTATPSTICNGSTSTITISGSLNDATDWHIYTGSCGGTQVGTTGSTFTVSPTTTTTYYIRGEGGCVTPGACASIDVNVGNDPTADAGSNGTIDCANSSVTLDGSGSASGANISYLWTTNDGNIVSGSTTLTPTVDAAGTYTLTVTNTDTGCTSSDNAVVTSNGNLPTAEAGGNGTIDCTNTTETLNGTGSSTGANISYLWTTNDGNIVSGSTTLTPTVDAAGTYTLTVTNTDTGCTSSDNAVVNDDSNPPTAQAGYPTTTIDCFNNPFYLNGTGSSTGANITYLWTTNDGNIIEDETTIYPFIDTAGTYTITVTNTSNGCSASDSILVISDGTAPTVVATATNNLDCNNSTVTLSGAGSSTGSGITYLWTTNDGNIVSGETTLSPVVDAAGTYTLTGTDGNCQDSDSVDISFNPDNEDPKANCPADIIVDTDAGLCNAVVDFDIPAPDDNCGATSTANYNSGITFDLGTTTVTVTATDDAGNTDTCTFTVTVEDNEDPTIICPEDITIDTDLGVCTGFYTLWTYIVDENCGFTTSSEYGGTKNFPIGETTITGTVTDDSGNTASCTFTVTVEDNEDPTANCPDDITIDTDSGSCDALVTFDIPDAGDNCGATATVDISSGTTFALGTTTVTVTATDDAGNTDTCEFTVTVEDNEAPDAVCKDLELTLDANGEVSITAADVDGGSTDNCGVALVELDADDQDWDCAEVGSHVVTLTVTDDSGNESECYAEISIEDDTPPNIECNDLTVSVNSSGFYILDAEVVGAGSTDNCGEVDLMYDLDEDVMLCEDAGSVVTVTLTVTDGSGNSSTCMADITVEDNTPPTVLECMNDLELTTDPGVCTANSPFEDWSYIYTDNCLAEGLVVTDDNPYNYDFPVGTTTVTLTFTDNAGNTATCSFDITVTDEEPPVITCEDTTVELDENGTVSINPEDVLAVSYQLDLVSSSGDNGSFDEGFTDFTAPVLTTQTLSFDWSYTTNDGPFWDTFGYLLNGVYTQLTSSSNGNNQTGSATVDVAAGDVFGFRSYTVDNIVGASTTTVSNFVPGFAGEYDPANWTLTLINSDGDAIFQQSAAIYADDNCGIASLSVSPNTFGCSDIGDNIVTVTAIDVNGNESTCEATVTVEDNTPPIITCIDATVELDATGSGSITPEDVLAITYDLNLVSSSGDNGSGSQGLTDFTVPVLTTQTLTFNWSYTTPDGAFWDTFGYLLNGVYTQLTNSSGGYNQSGSATIDVVSGDVFGFRSLTVDNVVGASTTTVSNFVPGFAGEYNPANWTLLLVNSDGTATFEQGTTGVYATDNCGVATFSVSPGSLDEPFDCSNVGENIVTVTVTDVNGNVSTCESTVTVEDNVDPEAICQDITVELDENGEAVLTAADIDGGSTDACGIASLEIDAEDVNWGCDDIGENIVTLTVTDNNGNSSTCDAIVTIEDNVDPEAICADITIQLDEDGAVTITAADIDGGSTDACGIESIEIASDDADWNCDEVGENTVTLTVTDTNGNSSTCEATVTVEDNIPPVLDCPNIEINLDPGLCGAVVDYDVESTDNCGVASEVTASGPESGEYLDYHDGPWTVTMDVTDVNGNVSSCDFTITMNVYSNPTETLACNDHVLVALDEDGCSTIGADMILEGGPYGCYDDYEVSVENSTLEVCCDQIGSELTVVVTDPATGNTCEGTIEVFDNLTPYCVSIEDYTIACEAELPSPDDVNHIGYPVFGDNCTIDQVYLSVETILNNDICSDPGMVIERIWYAIDASGNIVEDADVCTQQITIERTPLTFPVDQTFDCASYSVEDLTPDLTGEPTPASAEACMYHAVYTDQVLPLCGGLSKIIRTWTVMDWCTGEVILTDANGTSNVQVLKLMDGEGPSIDATDIVVGTDTDACSFTGFVNAPVITDNCTGVASVQMFITGLPEFDYAYDADGNVIGGYLPAPGLELGSATLLITATDACGNYSEAEVTITVEDQTEPLPICDEITQVAVSTDGIAEVFAETFDDGSYDNCCLDGFDVTRMDDGTFGPSVIFDCADIGATTQVIFRAHDCFGNSNTCMVEVLVEDKIAPHLAVPAGTEISCDDYFANIAAELDAGNGAILDDLYGTAIYGDNCDPILDYSYTYGVDQCGVGSITRNWTVNDASGNGPVSGSQTISIYHVSDWSVSFPGDLDATCVDGALPDFGTPTVSDDACEMIAISFTDTQFDVVPDACYKIVRAWSAINWCTYPDEAAVTANQVIKVTDDEAPIFDVEDFTVEITEGDCDVAVTLPTPDVTDCSPDITIETSSDLPAGEAGPGTYTANYVVSDGCGNFSYDVVTITVVDAKDPTPYVTDQIVTEIMQTGMTQLINVNDFDIGSFDNCSDVVLSFSPDVTDTDVQFTCDDIGDNTLEIWVTDEAGNQDFATVTLTVQDNMNVCGPGSLTVAGALTTAEDQGIEDATVDINGGLFTQDTDETGTFGFDLDAGGDYSVVPSLDLDASNGVTTFDIVLITQHILGMNPLNDPLKMIAADANNSNTVTTLDVVAIRMVILQITDAFPNNTSWRFVDKDHVFTDPTSPWDFPEVVNINNLDQELLNVDFTGIKIGDVNGSAQANFMSPAEARNGNSFELRTMDKQVSAGDEVRVTLGSDATISGMQFTLEHNGLEYKGMEAGLMGAEHIASHESALTFSWNEFELRDLSNENIVTLIFEAKGAIQLSESLVITSSMTKAEGYTDQGIESVDLVFDNNKGIANVLYQNVPNPFDGQTVVSFRLNKASKAQILITDVDGKVIQEIEGMYPQGLNSVELDRIQKAGVYYYQLNTDGFTATKKMIKI